MLYTSHLVQDGLEGVINVVTQLSGAMSPSAQRLQLNDDRPTGHSQIREADAAHAMSSPCSTPFAADAFQMAKANDEF
jgi:hypothetical protein